MPKSGKRIRHGAQCLHRLGGIVMVYVHIQLHHLVEIEGFDAAADRHAHGVADEIANVMIFDEGGILRQDRALGRILDVCFERDQSILARLVQQVVHHLQRFEISFAC